MYTSCYSFKTYFVLFKYQTSLVIGSAPKFCENPLLRCHVVVILIAKAYLIFNSIKNNLIQFVLSSVVRDLLFSQCSPMCGQNMKNEKVQFILLLVTFALVSFFLFSFFIFLFLF